MNKKLERKADVDELVSLRNKEGDAKKRERLTAVIMAHDGRSCRKIGDILHRHHTTISRWIERFNEEGVKGLEDKPRSGRPRKLNEEQIGELKRDLKKNQRN